MQFSFLLLSLALSEEMRQTFIRCRRFFYFQITIPKKMRRISPRSILSAIVLSVCCIFIIFLMNNLNGALSEPEPLPVTCDCPKLPPQIITVLPAKIEPPVPPKVEVPVAPKVEDPPPAARVDPAPISPTIPPLPPCTPVEKDAAVQRAIIIYYPHHQSEYFFPEVRW